MKRDVSGIEKSTTKGKSAKARVQVPDYCDVLPVRNDEGEIVWPAPEEAMEGARRFIKDCVAAGEKALIVPDKDADGLSSGVILYRALIALGLPAAMIDVHLKQKGMDIHQSIEREAMEAKEPAFVFVLDQGSIAAPAIVNAEGTRSLVIDHHLSDEFPEGAEVVSACHYPPVATSSLLTYEICKTLHHSLEGSCAYLACIGTHGDLGNTLKWNPPFPDMAATLKEHSRKAIQDAVALLNAPRRTARYDVQTAWEALLESTKPKDLLLNKRLLMARAEINDEVERHTHTPPKFSKDGKIAVLRINSAAQVHPVIATRWAGYLNSKALEIVMVANSGYLPGLVNFSCRIARCARARDPPVNIIESLKAAADLSTEGLSERLGTSFARGHKEASGGIVPSEAFEELMVLLKVGEKPDKVEGDSPARKKQKTIDTSPQKNTLGNYFKAKT
ncbi:putative dhh family protein [Phaeomoniella chlamydospora]|uniref:Putative dhh family protein n=1 Tax=Phaeomoniella chlamydospora TaxID=158046 RepID=A0A0G2F321_PHACM|nr:putative dhh family protein [Phaeomoniella chlamydospora]